MAGSSAGRAEGRASCPNMKMSRGEEIGGKERHPMRHTNVGQCWVSQ
jgi:hypothetical protein